MILKVKKPENMEDDDWEEKQTLAAATIRLCPLDQVMQHHVTELRHRNKSGTSWKLNSCQNYDYQAVSEIEII